MTRPCCCRAGLASMGVVMRWAGRWSNRRGLGRRCWTHAWEFKSGSARTSVHSGSAPEIMDCHKVTPTRAAPGRGDAQPAQARDSAPGDFARPWGAVRLAGMQVYRTPNGAFEHLPDFPWEPAYAEVDDPDGGTLRVAYPGGTGRRAGGAAAAR